MQVTLTGRLLRSKVRGCREKTPARESEPSTERAVMDSGEMSEIKEPKSHCAMNMTCRRTFDSLRDEARHTDKWDLWLLLKLT